MVNVGDKIKMDGERHRYTVQGVDDRYVVATKPFNARRTYLYTIIDRKEQRRGPIGLIFGLPEDVDTPQGAYALLADMQVMGWEVSHRRSKPLTDTEIEQIGQ